MNARYSRLTMLRISYRLSFPCRGGNSQLYFASVVLCRLAFLFSSILPPATSGAQAGGTVEVPSSSDIEAHQSGMTDADLRKLAERGEAQAQYAYGLREARRANQDRQRAFGWMFRAVANGQNLTPAEEQASREKWNAAPAAQLRQAAESGERGAQWFLGQVETEKAMTRLKDAFHWVERAATQSLAAAEFDAGIQYLDISGFSCVKADIKQCQHWLTLSADHGFEPALHKLADLYLCGETLPPDLGDGIEYLRRAADLRCPRAWYDLARRYANGDGEPRNASETPQRLFGKAARAGYVPAQIVLAERYRSGTFTHKDFVRAIQLYQLIERGGLQAGRESAVATSDSPFNTSIISVGHDETAPVHEALDLVNVSFEPKQTADGESYRFARVLGTYLKATERSDGSAAKSIGDLYLEGEVVPNDKVQALTWFLRAASRGYTPASAAADKLRSQLSPQELAEADRQQKQVPQAFWWGEKD